MPYNVYCDSCHNHLAKGSRYNAEKKAVGKYFTTTIWNFKMKCHHCQTHIEVQTDPQNRDYALTKGIHRVLAEEWKPEDTNTPNLMDEAQQNELRSDPFKKLEHLQEDQEFADDEKEHLVELQELRDRLSADDYDKNYALRKKFRDKKKEIEHLSKEAQERGLSIPLLPKSEEDTSQAHQIRFITRSISLDQQRSKERLRIKSASIFGEKSKKEVSKRMAVQKCIKQGVDPKLFMKKGEKRGDGGLKHLGTGVSMTTPARTDFKHKHQKFVKERRATL